MKITIVRNILHLLIGLVFCAAQSFAQSVLKTMLRLPDTGQNTSYTTTFGEDNDYTINPPVLRVNGDGTVTDTVTGLMWQQADGGEMAVEDAGEYADSLTLGGYSDWRLPTPHEAFSILNHQNNGPALDTKVFTKTGAEYWWTSAKQVNDATKIWVINAGGGIGNHLKTETVSAGGTKKIHVRAVRDIKAPTTIPNRFTDNGDGTITDNLTSCIWQKITSAIALTWEGAILYAENLTLGGASDWRLPNIKELQSISDENQIEPSVQTTYFPSIGVKKYWSSTSLPNQTTRAWYLNTQFGITTYDLKTATNYAVCVRGGNGTTTAVREANSYKENVRVLPNPATTEILITIDEANQASNHYVELKNMLGQVVFSSTIIPNDREILIGTQSLDSGLYFVSVYGVNLLETCKIILNK